jgi:hypothetical protein
MGELMTGPSLAELMAHRQLTMDELLAWAPEIAMGLEAMHAEGRSHGNVSAAEVRIDGHRAVLMPGGAGFDSEKQPEDIAQFAGLLKAMLKRATVASDEERASWRVIDKIASTNANASEGSRIKKVTAALKLVRPKYRAAAQATAEAEAVAPRDDEEQEAPPLKRVLMLVREVPPEEPERPRRYAKTIHLWAYFATAVGLAVTACMFYLRCAR